MSYTPTTWSSGDLITSTKLNKIEQGLAAASDLDTTVTEIENEVTELKNDLDDVESLFIISNNLFNKDDTDIVLNSEIAANGTISEKIIFLSAVLSLSNMGKHTRSVIQVTHMEQTAA